MQNRRILIVDDTQSLHDDFKKILLPPQVLDQKNFEYLEGALFEKNPGGGDDLHTPEYELDFAHQGEEAFNKAIQAFDLGKPYAVIFMDSRMPPGWDGITTISKIWERVPLTEMVICTAYSDYSLEEVIKKFGNSDRLLILKKPFDSIEVQQIAIALTVKWNLEQESVKYMETLEDAVASTESLVRERTNEVNLERAKGVTNRRLTALGEVASGVAHEINNHLAIMLVNVGIQKELLSEETFKNPKILEISEKIETATKRIATLIDNLMTESRNTDPEHR